MAFQCDCCHRHFGVHELNRSVEGKKSLSMVGLSVGLATRNIWAALALTVLGALIGHLIDEVVTPECPLCGEILKIVARDAW